MGFKFDGYSYEMPWRENFEGRAAAAWWLSLTTSGLCLFFSTRPATPFLYMAGICATMATWRSIGAWRLYRRQAPLKGRQLSFITVPELAQKIRDPQHASDQWIGRGFIWEHRHAQAVNEILKSDYFSAIRDKQAQEKMGASWIHGLNPKESELWQPLKHIEGHTLITGNPGTGKTRLFDLLISQAILRGESVLIIDPKGDKELRDNARRACRTAGHADRFVYFHPAFPEESVSIDPLKNFNRSTELASRIGALMPKGGSSDSFTAFAWQTVNRIFEGFLICAKKPTLLALRHYIEFGAGQLLCETIRAYIRNLRDADTEQLLSSYDNELTEARAAYLTIKNPRNTMEHFITAAAAAFYRAQLSDQFPSPEIEGLITLFEHDHAHFSKMIASLLPVLEMLTAGSLAQLLSPDEKRTDITLFDSKSMLEEQKVVCIGLDALSDAMVGHMVGSLFLSDLASVAGARFNYEDPRKMRPINIFVDEASEVLNEPFIQLLNKGRGAGMRLFVATQTIADFAAQMGSTDKANQILGNINNKFALRTYDLSTQEYLAEHMPKTSVTYVQRGQGVGGSADTPLMHTGHLCESLVEKEVPLFAPQLFSMMPNLEYLAFISGGVTLKGRLPILVGGKELKEKPLRNTAASFSTTPKHRRAGHAIAAEV